MTSFWTWPLTFFDQDLLLLDGDILLDQDLWGGKLMFSTISFDQFFKVGFCQDFDGFELYPEVISGD